MMLSDPPSDVANGCVVGYLAGRQPRYTVATRTSLFQASFDMACRDIDDTHKAQHLALSTRFRSQLCKLLVIFRQTRDEVVARRRALECRRNQRGGLHRLERLQYGETGGRTAGESGDGSGEDSEFAGDVKAIEVVCRVWLLDGVGYELERQRMVARTNGVAFFAGHGNDRGKCRSVRMASGEFVEDVAHGARKNTLNPDDLRTE